MKKFSKVAILIVALVACLSFLAGCDSITEIKVSGSEAPRTAYVQGQDLDLNEGSIEAISGDKSTQIKLNAEGVVVEGYDKNKLGEQELTVTYKEKTAKYTVNVVPRVQVTGYDAYCFVGDSLNLNKGIVKVAADNAKTFTELKLSEVTLEGFDSSTAGEKTVTVKCTANGQNYESSFKAYVLEVAAISLKAPNKIAYQSHDGSIDLSGGYITLTDANNKLEKQVALTKDMISGFDLGAATLENRTSPLSQEVTVTYKGMSKKFSIAITYSNVSLIKLRAKECATLDWSGDEFPEFSDELGINAKEAVELYAALTASDKAKITEQELLNVMRPAAIYGANTYLAELNKFKKTFIVNNGTVYWINESYEAVKADYEILSAKESVFKTTGAFVDMIKNDDKFKTMILWKTYSLEQLLSNVYSPNTIIEFIEPRLKFALDLYDLVKDIPESWDSSALAEHSTAIDAIKNYLVTNSFTALSDQALFASPAARTLIAMASKWRTNDDIINILYCHYYYNLVKSENAIDRENGKKAIDALVNICLPGKMETLWENCYYTAASFSQLASGKAIDATSFLIYYTKSEELIAELSASTDELTAYLFDHGYAGFMVDSEGNPVDAKLTNFHSYYANVNQRVMVSQTSYIMVGGYRLRFGTMLGNATFEAFVKQYLDTVQMSSDDEGFGAAVEALYNGYMNLEPHMQFVFLSTINPFYRSGLITDMWDYSQGHKSTFTLMIYRHYLSKFGDSEDLPNLFGRLGMASEYYAKKSYMPETIEGQTTYTDLFKSCVKSSKNIVELNLSSADEAIFNSTLKSVYDKYVSYANKIDNVPETVNFGDYAEQFTALDDIIANFDKMYYLLSINSNNNTYAMMLALYSKALPIVENIRKAPANIIDIYRSENIAKFTIYSGSTAYEIKATYEFTLNYYFDLAVNYLVGNKLNTGALAYDIFVGDVQNFYKESCDTMLAYILKLYDEFMAKQESTAEDGEEAPAKKYTNPAATQKAVNAYLALSPVNRYYAINLFDGRWKSFWAGVKLTYTELGNEVLSNMFSTIASTEEIARTYVQAPTADYNIKQEDGTTVVKNIKEIYGEFVDKLKAAYEALSTEDKATFDADKTLKAIYDDIFATYNAAKAAWEAEANPEA